MREVMSRLAEVAEPILVAMRDYHFNLLLIVFTHAHAQHARAAHARATARTIVDARDDGIYTHSQAGRAKG